MIKKLLKYFFFRKKGVDIDFTSSLNKNVSFCNNFKNGYIRNSNLQISKLGNGCYIENAYLYGTIEIGNHVSISGPGTVLHAGLGKIKIGNFCSIGQNVTIQEFNHNYHRKSTYAMNFFFFSKNFKDDIISKGDVIIEDDVWIGSNVVILSGIQIGRGCVIGAGSIVTKSVDPYSIVVGNPAKVLKKRFSDAEIEKLEKCKWWEWDDERILSNRTFFEKIRYEYK